LLDRHHREEDRCGNEWDYGFSNYEARGGWEARFNEAADKVYTHYCGDRCSGHVGYLEWAQRRHVHQPARVPGHRDVERESGTFSVYVKRIKVYNSVCVNVTGLEPDWGGRYSGQ